ncbi:MAG: hypothetical protein ACREYE_22155 [Gammaproteobacteria bacterium]
MVSQCTPPLRACEKSTALGTSRSDGARNPHVFQYTLWLLSHP